MRKKLFCWMITICMLLTMLPGMAWADGETATEDGLPDGALDMADGSIVITATGYKQGDAAEETAYTGDYVISQTDAATATGNTIDVKGGDPTITLDGVNISADTPISVTGKATFVLSGSNYLRNTSDYAAGIKSDGGTVIINGTHADSLTITSTGGHYSAGIGVHNGEITINGGNIKVTCSGNGYGIGYYNYPIGSNNRTNITINGGSLDIKTTRVYRPCIHCNGGTFTFNGGTLKSLVHNQGSYISAGSVIVNGGNVKDYYTGNVAGRVRTTLLFADGYAGKEVLVSEVDNEFDSEENYWSAMVGDDGKMTTYLDVDTEKVYAKLDDAESIPVEANVCFGIANFGTACTCGTAAAIHWSTELKNLTLYKDMASAIRAVSASCEASASCPATVHPGYKSVNVSLSIKDAEGNPVTTNVDDYATYQDGKLTLNRVETASEYTATLEAKTENEVIVAVSDVKVTMSAERAGDIKWSTELADVSLFNDVDSAERNISASYAGTETMNAAYSNVTVSVDSVKDEADNDIENASAYVTYQEGKLTVSKMPGISKYFVTLKAVTENQEVVATQKIAVETSAGDGFDLAKGAITVTAGAEDNEGKVVFKQGSRMIAADPSTPVTITGRNDVAPIITITNCSPTILVKDVATWYVLT